ncbi:ATP-binding protein [Dyella nitratireducens]|uniref:histidine kinase n=1 Tax=Dyella nitratireducens TaxID=1849580 RepID=A0ABQ1FIG6_9GAMM|nr:ATP-binding protein [Dyella nitratireducens]GGA16761.1 two-component sensor histidine kinase [Dyella nitratireducens]GLQ44882.1 two-component sensor histidine kinase [Dyella nitratireducens]
MKRLSLSGRLRWMIIAVLIAVLLPIGLYSYNRTLKETRELLDGRLAQSARTLDVLVQHAGLDALRMPEQGLLVVPILGREAEEQLMHTRTYETEVGYQVFDMHNRMRLTTTNLAKLPLQPAPVSGFENHFFEGYGWRIFTLVDDVNNVVIRVGERDDSRRDITHALWLDLGLPQLVGLPLLAVLVGWAVKRGLRPLERLRQALASRAPGSRQPIQLDRSPQELQPVVDALNTQLERLEDALERERRFSADVAHELRTPLASTMIHLDGAMAAPLPADAQTALTSAQSGLARLARRIEQLLALARLEAGAAVGQRSEVDLIVVAMNVIDELAPLLGESGVEFAFAEHDDSLVIYGYEAAMAALLRNLIENAMHHVPLGGQVQLSMRRSQGATVIEVIDNGPGIPLERRASVFARFHRESSGGDGYGLGLSIVQRAAQLHNATIELLDAPSGRGLRVRVAIPGASFP